MGVACQPGNSLNETVVPAMALIEAGYSIGLGSAFRSRPSLLFACQGIGRSFLSCMVSGSLAASLSHAASVYRRQDGRHY